jgi:hypothetical protein
MHAHLLGLIAAYLALAPRAIAADNPSIVFPTKTYTDTGYMVHVGGTLTLSAEGVSHPTNTSAITCYQGRQECELIVVSAVGLRIFSLGIPETFTVRVWEPARIVAEFVAPCENPPKVISGNGRQASMSETLIIDRNRQTAELNQLPRNDAKLSKIRDFSRNSKAIAVRYRWRVANIT